MTNTVIIKRSDTANSVPTAGSLTYGELAINYTDGNLFYKNNSDQVTVIASNKFVSVSGNVTAGNVLSYGQVSASGNITGANINAGNLSLSGNIISEVYVSSNIKAQNIQTDGVIHANLFLVSGDVEYANVDGTAGQVLTTDGNGSTYFATVTAGVATQIISGDTSVTIPTANANVYTSVNGVANVVVVTTSGQSVVGNVTATGNISGNYIIGNGSQLTGLPAGYANSDVANYLASGTNSANIITSGNVSGGNLLGNLYGTVASLSGNITGANINGANLSLSGNVLSAINTTSNITTTANIAGGYFIGNGSQLTGLPAGYANSDVSNYLASGTDTANIITSGNVSGGNLVTSGLITATGNITGGNISTAGQISATSGLIVAGNIAGGNLIAAGGGAVIAGNVDATGNVTGANINGGNLSLSGNVISAINTTSNITTTGQVNASTLFVTGAAYSNATSITARDQLVTKFYVDNAIAASLNIHDPVAAATTTALTATYTAGGTTPTWTDILYGNTLVTASPHGLATNDQITFYSTTNGIVSGTAYFVFDVPSATSITISDVWVGDQIQTLTNGSGLSITSRAKPGVGATLTNAGANAALTLDGVSLSVSNRVLIKNQANAAHNGIYTVTTVGNGSTAWVLTRSTDTDQFAPNSPTGLSAGDYTFVTDGLTQDGTSYVQTTNAYIIIGTTNLVYTQFAGSVTYTGTSPIVVTGQTISLANTTGTGDVVVLSNTPTLTTPNIGAATGTSVSVTGNVTGANINGANLSLSGNVLSAINTTSNITTTANISGGNILGNGRALTGVIKWTAQANTAPSTPTDGDFWWNTYTGIKYQYTNDGTTSTWIDQSPPTTFATITVGNIVNSNANGVGNIGAAGGYFNTVFAKATSAQYADLAEAYSADAVYPPGTVLSFGGDVEVTLTTGQNCNRIAGVVSTNPAHVMNSAIVADHVAILALTGRVPTSVVGQVRKGDMMVSAGNGAAMASSAPAIGTVIGKALENFDGDSGVIEIVVGRL